MDRDTLSPEHPHGQGYSVTRATGLFTHSFIHVCLPESPKWSSPTYGGKHKVTVHRAPCRQKTYIQWGAAWFPKCLHAYMQSCFFLPPLTEYYKVSFYCSDFVIDRS